MQDNLITFMIEENELKKEVDDLVGMLDSLRLIKDKGRYVEFEREVRLTFNLILKKMKK